MVQYEVQAQVQVVQVQVQVQVGAIAAMCECAPVSVRYGSTKRKGARREIPSKRTEENIK